MTEIYYLSASDIAKQIKEKKLSCEEVMQAYLSRITAVNPSLNAFCQLVDPDELRYQSRQADQKLRQGKAVGRLHGVPISIKDFFHVKGLTSTCACPNLNRRPAVKDATLVARLKAEGALVLGLTNVPELLVSVETDSALYGQTKNPYDLARSSGGSSGGEAAIIAAGGSSFGIGSDAAGSIRIPAHCCGIAGLKPTQGRIPSTGTTFGNANGVFSYIASPGPMARFVEDLITGLSIIAGPDGKDPHAPPVPLDDPSSVMLNQLRVAYYTEDGFNTPTEAVQQCVRNAAHALHDICAKVEENRPRTLAKTFKLLWETLFLGGDGGQYFIDWLKHLKIKNPSPLLQEYLDQARQCEISVSEMRKRWIEIDQFRIDLLSFMQNYDLILCPVSATPAKLHGQSLGEIKDFTYTMSYSLAGWPAVVIRAGTSPEGLPIGIQIVAKPWQDHVALAVAKELEQLLGGWIAPTL